MNWILSFVGARFYDQTKQLALGPEPRHEESGPEGSCGRYTPRSSISTRPTIPGERRPAATKAPLDDPMATMRRSENVEAMTASKAWIITPTLLFTRTGE